MIRSCPGESVKKRSCLRVFGSFFWPIWLLLGWWVIQSFFDNPTPWITGLILLAAGGLVVTFVGDCLGKQSSIRRFRRATSEIGSWVNG
jgi:hypothetical protein